MKSSLRIIAIATATALGFLAAPLGAQTTFTYDVAGRNTDFQPLDDNWAGASVGNWVAGGFQGSTYARNQSGSDNTITRANDGGFSFSIPETATFVSLEVTARMNNNFFETGLMDGSTRVLGIGYGFGGSGKLAILDGFTRREADEQTIVADSFQTIRLDFDLVAGTADLTFDPDGSSTTVITGLALNANASSLAGADGLFIRTVSQFTGPENMTVTVIPEPSSAALIGLASLIWGASLMIRRRR